MIARWYAHDQSSDECNINHVISAWLARWTVQDQPRDQCIHSHVISVWSASWSYTDNLTDHALVNHVLVTWLSWPDHVADKVSPEYSLEGLMLKLKLQYFGHLIRKLTHLKRPWYWERMKAGGEADDRGWDGWMAIPTRWTWVWTSSRSWWCTGKPGMLPSMGCKESDTTEPLNWILF